MGFPGDAQHGSQRVNLLPSELACPDPSALGPGSPAASTANYLDLTSLTEQHGVE